MFLSKRYCVEEFDGTHCYRDDGFWYSEKGLIAKWIILVAFFWIFFAWFVGGHIHAKRRLRAGKPLLGYHRFLISYNERRRHGQVPQNHFTFYQTQNPYGAHPNPNMQGPYVQRQDGAWSEPPPSYQNNDAPPQYFPPPPGASKTNPNQGVSEMEMPQYGSSQPGPQQNGVVGSGSGDVEQGTTTQELPPRPARAKLTGMLDRFRR
jgi:heme/copper-type cytochrome/quinol oxidase subunit 1